MVKEELVIIPGEQKAVFNEDGSFTEHVDGRGEWHSKHIRREPQYVAIYVVGTDYVKVVAEVNCKKSKLENGIITMENPIEVSIPIRGSKNKLEGIIYSTFRKLITHKTTAFL